MPSRAITRALVEPRLRGTQAVRVGSQEFGVPDGSRVVPVRDGAKAVYLLNEHGTRVHVLIEHRGKVMELRLPHAIQMVVLAQRFNEVPS